MSMSKGALFFTILTAAALGACTKTDPASGNVPSATSTPSPPIGSATASAVPSASANPDLAVSGSPSNSAVVATATTSGTAPVASASAAANAECGKKPLPDCPLQAWMKANMNPPVSAGDTEALATAMDKSAAFAPSGYSNWVSIAKDGAKAAKSGNMDAAKQACRGCHEQYKKKYQTEMRGRKI